MSFNLYLTSLNVADDFKRIHHTQDIILGFKIHFGSKFIIRMFSSFRVPNFRTLFTNHSYYFITPEMAKIHLYYRPAF